MRVPRMLRDRRRAKGQPAQAEDEPKGYRHSQTDSWATTQIASPRGYEYGDPWWFRSMPVVIGFQPNPPRTSVSAGDEL